MKLPFSNAMSELNACDGDGGVPVRFEAGHSGAAAFDGAVVLFDNVV
ncbi:MAG: hypothetical protein JSR66_30120 [Proteobacteria bacterium]|nr:hypothetical protein [Pseudomonadota bacterium]